MNKCIVLAFMLLCVIEVSAQQKRFSYKFYGQVRADLFYNSRSNSETVDGLFYMYPNDREYDANGEDLNAKPDGSLYLMYTRVGVDVAFPDFAGGKVHTSAKIEADFRGSGTDYYTVRLRQAYFNMAWNHSSFLVGQTWHPFYGEVSPEILNLNMGAPYQPFSRAPQLRYRLTYKMFQLTAAAVWQSQYKSVGPSSDEAGETATRKSQDFIKYSCVPEFTLQADYKDKDWIVGAGVDFTSIVPRTQSVDPDGNTYKVNELITSVSAEGHVRYCGAKWLVAAKTVLGSNFTQASGVGGYGITSVDPLTGEQEYSPIRVSSTWLNVAYGSTWRPALFFGYLKNLGAVDEVSGVLGTGVNDGLGQLVTATAELTYNIPHWKFGCEYMLCNAWYGDLTAKAKVVGAHTVMNHRLVLSATFQF